MSEFTRKALIVFGLALAFLAVVMAGRQLVDVALVAFGAILYATFLSGIADLVARYTPLGHRSSLAVAVVAYLAGLAAFVYFVGPRVASEVDRMTELFPTAIERLQSNLAEYSWGQMLLDHAPDGDELADKAPDGMFGRVAGAFGTAAGMLTNIAILLLVGLYLAIAPRRYWQSILRLVPPDHRDRAGEVVDAMSTALRRWLVGRFLSMAVVGVFTAIGLWILGVPLPFLLGLLAGLLSFIPNLGPILSVVPAVLMALLESNLLALYVVILYIAVQLIESSFITPLIEQKAVSLPAPFLIMVQLAMGVLFGLAGLILATPLFVVAVVATQKLYLEDVLGEGT